MSERDLQHLDSAQAGSVNASEGRLLQDFLMCSAARSPAKVALVCGGERVTYGDLAARARRLGRALRARGVAAGDRVLLFAGNTVEQVVAFWGTLMAGAVAVPIDPRTKTEKLTWMMDHCRPSALVTESRLAATFVPAARAATTLRAIVVARLDERTATAWGRASAPVITDLAVALAAETPEPAGDAVDQDTAARPSDNARELACIIYTSGSTGRPKGVMLSHRNMTSAAASICQYLEVAGDDVIHGTLPLTFDYGLYQMLLAFRQGARLVLAPPFTLPAQVLKEAARERVTLFPGVPTMFAMLTELKDTAAWDLSAVRAVTSTAAALGQRHVETISRIFPGARVFSMYGVTECKRCTYLPPEDLARKPGSVGLAIPGTELWLEDDAGRRLTAPHQVGRIVVRGPTVMVGYWEDPEATSCVLRPGRSHDERVLVTSDLGRLDEDGYLTFVGRTDDIIKCRGEKVPPKEIETVLAAVPGVKEAAVVGVPDALAGESVAAFVALEEGSSLSGADLLRICRERLEAPMVPASITLRTSLPKSHNGKIDKLALRAGGA